MAWLTLGPLSSEQSARTLGPAPLMVQPQAPAGNAMVPGNLERKTVLVWGSLLFGHSVGGGVNMEAVMEEFRR